MLKQGKGSIVNISSVATAGVNRVPYSAAKGGVNALTRSIAMEYSGSGIRINAVAPGGTEAPPRLTPRNEEQPSEQEKAWYQQVVDQTVASSLLHRYGTLAEQANAILFLASDEASYIRRDAAGSRRRSRLTAGGVPAEQGAETYHPGPCQKDHDRVALSRIAASAEESTGVK